MAGIYDNNGNIVGGVGSGTINLNTPSYNFSLNSLLNDPSSWFSNNWKAFTTPNGSGDNAQSDAQLGLGLASSLYGGYLQQKMGNKQLEEAKRQFDFSKAHTQANFMNQGTNFINQGLWQIEALNAFNPNAAAERAQNFNSAVNQMNTAAQGIGLNNAFGQQQNSLQKYTQLANDGPRMA